MNARPQEIDVADQLERARATLGEALGLAQDIGHTGLDVEQISGSLARAVKTIFSVQSNGLEDPYSRLGIGESMDHLRQTLVLLQDVNSDDPAIERITGTVARILALLFPVSKIMEEMEAQAQPAPEESPIPLTQATGQEESEPAPIPLTPKSPQDAAADQGKERRVYERRHVEVDIGIHSDTNFFAGFSQDISTGGLFIATYDVLELGTELNVNFKLPRGPVLSLDGVVRWLREYNEYTPDMAPGMGVQFENLTEEDSRAINAFIDKHQPLFYEED